MAENKSKKLPEFGSNEEFVEFFDTHDMGEYEGDLPEAHFEMDIQRSRYLVSIDGYLMDKLLETAQAEQVSVEMLLDSWLKEKLAG